MGDNEGRRKIGDFWGLEDSTTLTATGINASDYDPFGVDYPVSTTKEKTTQAYSTTTAPRTSVVPTTAVTPPSTVSSISAPPLPNARHVHPALHSRRPYQVAPKRSGLTPIEVGPTPHHLAKVQGDALFGEARFDHRVKEAPGRNCLLYTSPSPRDRQKSRMPSSA